MPRHNSYLKAEKLAAIVLSCLVFVASLYLSILIRFLGGIPERNMEAVKNSLFWVLLGFIVVGMFSGVNILYNKTRFDLVIITAIDQFIVTVIVMATTSAGQWFAFPRGVVAINLVVGTILLSLQRVLVFEMYLRMHGTKRVMCLVVPDQRSRAVRNFISNKSPRYTLTHVVDGNYMTNIKLHLDEFDCVHVSDRIPYELRRDIYDYLQEHQKDLFLTAGFTRLLMMNSSIMNIEDESMVNVSRFEIESENAILKRFSDIIISLVGLILCSPIMLITAILVKATSPGPVFYKQVRVTRGGREFNILKFRSMTQDAEAKSGPVLSTGNDARVTKVGKYIRSLRIDELPQLINVLRGDMSFVGPRPERPFFVEKFTAQNARYPLRHNVRAGLTGYAQVYGKYASDFEAKLNFDLLYIKTYSLALDCKIMIQTVKILFDKVSSAGVEEEVDMPKELAIPEEVKILH